MDLVIVESPAKIKSISKYLGSNYQVKASMGHIVDLPKSELGVDIEKNFKPSYVVTKQAALADLKKAFANKNKLIIATDPDREGEAIGYHVANRLGLVDKNGKLKNANKLKRIAFTSITKGAVLKALDNPREIDFHLFDAQQARRVLDRLVGYKLSPLLWKKIRFGLSAGRVQSVALRLVVEREEEREKFNKQEYWRIIASVKKNQSLKKITKEIIKQADLNLEEKSQAKPLSGTVFELTKINDKKAVIANEKQAKILLDLCLKPKWLVSNIKTNQVKRYPKPPFTTSTLQQTAANWLGFSAKRTMQAAQKLYEQGRITYMRTDSTNLTQEAVNQARKYITTKIGKEYLPPKAIFYRTKAKVAQEAHEAIRPTNFLINPDDFKVKSLDKDQWRLYQLIWQRAIASQMNPAQVEKGRVEIELKLDQSRLKIYKATFFATGQKMLFAGFLKIYPEKFEEQELPSFVTGDQVYPSLIKASQHFTQPPARYSEATLIKTLESFGIGRPSTYVPTLSTIQTRGYVIKAGKYLLPTDTGRVVIRFLKDNFAKIVDYDFTAQMENQLDEIANGKRNWIKMMNDFYQPFEKSLLKKDKSIVRQDYTVLSKAPDKFLCPECKSSMNVKLGRFGRFYSCSKWPKCKGMLGEDGKSDQDKEKELIAEKNSLPFKKLYKESPKTDDGRDYLLKVGRYGKFWAHPDYPKVKDARPLELKEKIKLAVYGQAPKAKDGQKMLLRRGRFGEFWAHPDYPRVKEVAKVDKKKTAEKKKKLGL